MYDMIKKGGFRAFAGTGATAPAAGRNYGEIARMTAYQQRDVGIEVPMAIRDVNAEVISIQATMYR